MKSRKPKDGIQWDIVFFWGLGLFISILFWITIFYLIWG